MLPARAAELKQVLKHGYELILPFAIGHEYGEEDREIAGFDDELLSYFTSHLGLVP